MTTQDVTSSTTLSVRLSSRTKNDLDRLARATKRTKSFLAGEAIEAYVARELEIVEGIKRGLADMKAGRVVPHDEAIRREQNRRTAIQTLKQLAQEGIDSGAGRFPDFDAIKAEARKTFKPHR